MWGPETVSEWQGLIADNPIYRSLQTVHIIAEQIATGIRRSAIVCGPPGVGKTWIFEEAFKRHNIKYRLANFASGSALIRDLHENPGGFYLIDDTDGMLRTVAILNVLKKITDTKSAKRYLEHKTSNPETSVPKFEVRARIVILTNTDVYSRKLLADARLGPHIAAINARCEPQVLSDDRDALWEYAVYLTVAERMLLREGIPRSVTEVALKYFAEHKWDLRDVSPRRLVQIAREIQRSPDNWQDLLNSGLDPRHSHYMEPPFMPKLLPIKHGRREAKPVLAMSAAESPTGARDKAAQNRAVIASPPLSSQSAA